MISPNKQNTDTRNGNHGNHGNHGMENAEPRNYANPEPLNVSHIGRSVTVTLINGRIESGKLKAMGAYMISIIGSNGKELIVNKGAIITVSVL